MKEQSFRIKTSLIPINSIRTILLKHLGHAMSTHIK